VGRNRIGFSGNILQASNIPFPIQYYLYFSKCFVLKFFILGVFAYLGYGNDSFFLAPFDQPGTRGNIQKGNGRLSSKTTLYPTVQFLQCFALTEVLHNCNKMKNLLDEKVPFDLSLYMTVMKTGLIDTDLIPILIHQHESHCLEQLT